MRQLLGQRRGTALPALRGRLPAPGEGADAAVIPIENTLAGSVHENYDHLLNFDFPIVAETSVRIVHNLIGLPGCRSARSAASTPTRRAEPVPGLLRQEPESRASALLRHGRQREDDHGGAPARRRGHRLLAGRRDLRRDHPEESIEDDRQNFTRFFLLRRPDWKPPKPAGGPQGMEDFAGVHHSQHARGPCSAP